MAKEFRFELLWNDNDLFEVRATAWTGTFGGSADIYVPIGGLSEAATQLSGFPRSPSDVRELSFGQFGPKYAGGAISLRFFCEDSAGHAFVEAKIESEHVGKANAQFASVRAPVEAAAVDTFVMHLQTLETERHGVAVLAVR
jgi:hypothetical protein